MFFGEFTESPNAFFIRGFLGVHPNSEIRNPFFSLLVLWGVHPKSESLFSLEVLWAIHPNSEIGNPFFFSRGFLGREFTQTPKFFFIRCFFEGSPKIRNPIIIRGFFGEFTRNPKPEVSWEYFTRTPKSEFYMIGSPLGCTFYFVEGFVLLFFWCAEHC